MLGYHEWLDGLTRGIAAHHAGMLPTFKEVVEELFQRGLVKVVFATETLALGINMPARSVVLEKLVKWNGETHADVTPGEYTQLTGRAGRRGIDVEGHAVVLWQPRAGPGRGRPASPPPAPTRCGRRSGRRTTWRSTWSARSGGTRAREILESSFAQFQADRAVVGLARQVRRRPRRRSTGYREAMTCHLGDFAEYAALRRALQDREAELSRQGAAQRRAAAAASLESLRIGDVIRVPAGKRSGLAVVLDPGLGTGGGRRSATGRADRGAAGRAALAGRLPVTGRADRAGCGCPKAFNPRSPQSRRDLAATPARPRCPTPATRPAAGDGHGPRPRTTRRSPGCGGDPRAHPCHGCDDREDHARWAERYHRLAARDRGSSSSGSSRAPTPSPGTFDRVCGLLESLGYLDGDAVTAGRRAAGPALHRAGPAGRRVRARRAVGRARRRRSWPPASRRWSYESRQSDDATLAAAARTAGCGDVLAEMVAHVGPRSTRLEKDHGLAFLREPDLGFAWAATAGPPATPLDDGAARGATCRPATSSAGPSS